MTGGPATLPARSLAVFYGASFVVRLPPSKPRNRAGSCSQLKIWNPNQISSDRREQHPEDCASIRLNAKHTGRLPRFLGSTATAAQGEFALHWPAEGFT
jgi:hypothetical protein